MSGAFYTKFKIFHYKDKIDSLPQTVPQIKAPIHIRIKPTNVCNHKCWYCAYRADDLQLGKDMTIRDSIPREKMSEIIDDLIDMEVKAVTFSGGGDPFVYPHLLETVRRLSNSPIRFAALTNGARLKGEIAEIFARHAVWLRVSIDGWDAESYAEYRGTGKKEFQKVMDNIENFKKLKGKCYLGISLIVDQKNAPHVQDFLKRMKSIGVDSVKVSGCVVSNEGVENNQYHAPIFDQVKKQIQWAKENLETKEFEIFDAYHELEENFSKDYNWCPYLQILPVIGADLNVYSCQDKAYNLEDGLLGSIKESRFKDFWFSDKKAFFKINPSKVCSHHCVANQKNKTLLEYLDADQEHLGFV